VQVMVIPIAERHREYAEKITSELREKGFRTELDSRDEKMGYKIREAQTQKIPYMLVCGDKEIEDGKIAVRHRSNGDLGAMTIEEFVEKSI